MTKKIAITIRGPIRPSPKAVIDNIEILKKSLTDFDIDTYLITWNNQDLTEIRESRLIDNYIILKEPETKFVGRILTTRSKNISAIFDRNYKAFFSQICEFCGSLAFFYR